MTIPCPVCSAPTNDGLLCRSAREGTDMRPPCTAALRTALRHLPDLMRELRITLTRQNQGAQSGGHGGETPMPFNVDASEVASTVTNTVGTWIRDLDERADPGRTMTEWCAWLLERMPAIRRHQAVEQMYDEITYSARILWRAIDRPADREFVQQCVICGHGVYVAPGADVAPCQRCRSVAERADDGQVIGFVPEYDVAAAHLTRVATLRAALLVPADLRTAVESISGIPVSIKLVRSWVNRGRLRPKGEADGVALYSVEDGLSLAAQVPVRPEPAPRRRVRRVSA